MNVYPIQKCSKTYIEIDFDVSAELFLGNIFDLFSNNVLGSPGDVDIFAHCAVSVMARNGFPEAFRPIRSRSVDEEGMEEDRIARLHLHVQTRHGWIVILNTVVRLVHTALK